MILRSAAGTGVREIARQLGVWPKTVRHWRSCWLSGQAEAATAASVGRFLKEADLKPHLVRGWLTPKPDPEFESKCAEVCAFYVLS